MDIILERTDDYFERGLDINILTVDNHADGVYLYLKLLKSDPERAEEVRKLLSWNGGAANSSGVGIGDIDFLGNVHPDQSKEIPITGFAHSPDDIPDLISMVGGAPLVIKLLEGTQGIGVVLCETEKAAESVLEAFMGLKANIMVQEYIREAGGADIRCLVVGDKVIAAMKRQAKPGEFRSNLHRGGTASLIKITPEERMTAVRAAKVMGLSVAGVDILRSNHGPVVMEVNSSPGLEGIETTTGKDVAGLIIDYIEKTARPNQTRTKGKG